jgi:hypothetical protein
MLFFMHSSSALQFLALLAAVGLFVWSLRHEGKGVALAKIISGISAVFILIGMACTAYFSVKYWNEGYFEGPLPMQMKVLGTPQMMNKPPMMQNRPGMPVPQKPGNQLNLPNKIVPPVNKVPAPNQTNKAATQ